MLKISLQKRERVVVTGGSVILGLMVLYHVAQGPWNAYQKSINDIERAEQLLYQARLWHGVILEARSGEQAVLRRVQRRGPGFDLFSFLHRIVRQMELEDRYNLESRRGAAISPRLAAVQVTLEGVNMEELVDFLHAVHDADNLVVLQQLGKLQAAGDGVGLDCRMTFLSPKAH